MIERRIWTAGFALVLGAWNGCHAPTGGAGRIDGQVLRGMTIAVAPAINQCGSTDFDPEHVADEMAAELAFVEGVSVIPVSRASQQMARLGWTQIRSAEDARQLAEALGADAILVFAVTAYDPFDPPRMGISAVLYGPPPVRYGGVDVAALAGRAADDEGPPRASNGWMLAQASRIFDASHEDMIADLKAYARGRNADDNPYGHRAYVVSQRRFARYCCHATVRLLVADMASMPAEQGMRPSIRPETNVR